MNGPAPNAHIIIGISIRVRGIVQGVGFRPAVWRLARKLGLQGAVWNDADGVVIQAWGASSVLQDFIRHLEQEPVPLARIDAVDVTALEPGTVPNGFDIVASQGGRARTDVSPDSAICPACLADITDPHNRRYRYPFTNCTHCGPRLSIIRAVPYDRGNTSMATFAMCPSCLKEYQDPVDRRFHAQANACPDCGPRVWLEDRDGLEILPGDVRDAIDAARLLIEQGAIVAIKGIGGIHLACDACNAQAVETLRQRKQRYDKPFALMAADIAMVERYAMVNDMERVLLQDQAAPIVILRTQGEVVAEVVAPDQHTLGFMLPYSPLHQLLMQQFKNPIVLTSGNRSDEPQCIDNDDAHTRLCDIADYFLLHDRDIVNRQDDSVVRVAAGYPRLLRRARGYAPTPLPLPEGFDDCSPVLAMGAELKNTFCLIQHGKAILSQHMGDLEQASALEDYYKNLALYQSLFEHAPNIIAVDCHPDYWQRRPVGSWPVTGGWSSLPCNTIMPTSLRAWRNTVYRWILRRYSALHWTAWAWATMAPSGEASSCWPITVATGAWRATLSRVAWCTMLLTVPRSHWVNARGQHTMTPDGLRELVRMQPFQPFRIHLTNGDTFDIRHPENLMVTRRLIAVAVPSDERGMPESAIWVSYVHIVKTEPIRERAT